MLALIVAGELVFALPFNFPRFFRPSMLEAFGFSNTQLGDLFAVYGITAMIAYFPGGALADHLSARTLMAGSLFATAAGGLYMATIPSAPQMALLYGYWGFTTIFLFWGALIRATREWGGDSSQGIAFGILDGGRGLVAASAATIAVALLAIYMPANAELASAAERESGLQSVIRFYTLITFLAGVLAWFAIPVVKVERKVRFNPLKGMGTVLQRPIVWAQAIIILCAYCGYKGLDNYSLYAVQVLGMDEVEGARLASYGVWIRPVAAVMTGLIADRFGALRSIGVTFVILAISFGSWSMVAPDSQGIAIIYVNFFVTHLAVFALRGIYFALLEDVRTPMYLTGASVGMASFIGFTPDAFFGPIAGRILDANPGLVGHQNVFVFLAAVAAVGFFAVLWIVWLRRHGPKVLWPEDQFARSSPMIKGS